MPGVSKSMDAFRESPTRRIDAIRERLRRERRDVIVLSAGQPSVPPPRDVRMALGEELLGDDMELFAYTPSQGRRELREAISDDLRRTGGVEVDPDDLTVTAGGQEAMFAAFMTILDPGDEVILMDPTYFGYKPILEYFGARIVRVGLDMDDGFKLDVEALKEKVGPRTKAVVLVSPDNPTGSVMGVNEVKAVADLAVDHDFWIVSDEAYRMLIYEGSHVYPYMYAPDRVVSINTFSKDPGMPGWRLGFVYGPRELIGKIKLAGEEMTYCPPSISQRLALLYLKSRERESHVRRVVDEYRARRDALMQAIKRFLPEARFQVPHGSMFVFMDLGKYVDDGDSFAEHALEKHGVAVVPGSYFSDRYRQAVRASFVWEPTHRLEEGIRRLREAAASWRGSPGRRE